MREIPEMGVPEIDVEKKDDTCRQAVLASLERIGFREVLCEKVIDRLTLLEKHSHFNQYSRRIESGMEKVLKLLEEYHALKYPEIRRSEKQRLDGCVAAILHDIGKSGPVDATPEEQKMIIKIFAQEEIRDLKMPIAKLVSNIFSESEVAGVLQMLEKHAIEGTMPMRDFWDKHAQWTHDNLERYPQGLSEHARIIAGSHHIDRDVDPYKLLEAEVPLDARLIGTLEEYMEAIEGRALIALDQYEAATTRGGLSHKDAIFCVRKNIAKHKDEKLMQLVLKAVDELGEKNALFEDEV